MSRKKTLTPEEARENILKSKREYKQKITKAKKSEEFLDINNITSDSGDSIVEKQDIQQPEIQIEKVYNEKKNNALVESIKKDIENNGDEIDEEQLDKLIEDKINFFFTKKQKEMKKVENIVNTKIKQEELDEMTSEEEEEEIIIKPKKKKVKQVDITAKKEPKYQVLMDKCIESTLTTAIPFIIPMILSTGYRMFSRPISNPQLQQRVNMQQRPQQQQFQQSQPEQQVFYQMPSLVIPT